MHCWFCISDAGALHAHFAEHMLLQCLSQVWHAFLEASPKASVCPAEDRGATMTLSSMTCLQVLSGAALTSDGPWLQAITEKAFTEYCERLKGFSSSTQVNSCMSLQSRVQLYGCWTVLGPSLGAIATRCTACHLPLHCYVTSKRHVSGTEADQLL